MPACIGHGSKGSAKGEAELRWTTPIEQLDMAKFLPMFVDGVREKEDPYKFVAIQGTFVSQATRSNKNCADFLVCRSSSIE